VRESKNAESEEYVNLISLRCEDHRSISGTFAATPGRGSEQRIVEIDGHDFDIPPAAHMLLISNDDRPGVIGTVGTVLGNHLVNISDMDVGRVAGSGTAIMLLSTTSEVAGEVLEELRAAPGILRVDALQG
jgi:D-3-phosphoglycerate dehydrogenase